MALANFSEDQKTAKGLSCSEELSEEEDGELILLSGINILLSIAAFIGNTLILVALHKETSLHPPSKLLYRNLAITDLCVGIIVEPSSVAYWMSLVNKRWNVCYYLYWITIISAQILCFASLYTLTAISVDRLLALLLGLRYRQVATLRRAYVTLIVFWLLSVVSGIQITSWLGRVGLTLCLVTSVFSYVKVIFTLRQNQIHVHNHVFQGQPSQAMPMNTARYIQKGSVQCIVGASNICCLLSAVKCSISFDTSKRDDFVCLYCFAIFGYFSVFKFVIEPFSLLLEDQGSKASCKRNIKATLLLIHGETY